MVHSALGAATDVDTHLTGTPVAALDGELFQRRARKRTDSADLTRDACWLDIRARGVDIVEVPRLTDALVHGS